MKRKLLTLSIAIPVSLIIGMSCSLEAPAPPPGAGGAGGAAGAGTGGSTTGTGGATTGTGGDPTGTGGATTGTGGATTGTGGATTGTGGTTTGTGGATTGTGGATTGTGGAAGTGGATTGTGGAAGTGGATTGTGGATTGTGGSTAGAGGSAGGGVDAGKGGSAGSAGAGGSSGAAGSSGKSDAGIPPGTIVGNFDGYLFTAPCGDAGTGYDCLNAGCTNNAKTVVQDFPIMGTAGAIYDVTIRVRGIVEVKNYSGGMRRATGAMDASAQGGDFLYVGGTAPNSTYNTYELHVLNANDTPATGTGAAVDYYLNGRDGSAEAHQSFALNYQVTVPVVGGGKLRFRVFDSNCRQIMNCGPGTGSNMCTAPRNLTLTGSDPAPPASFTQPFVGSAPGGATGQWVFIDVLSVVQR